MFMTGETLFNRKSVAAYDSLIDGGSGLAQIDVLILRALRNLTGLVKSLDTRKANLIRPGWLRA